LLSADCGLKQVFAFAEVLVLADGVSDRTSRVLDVEIVSPQCYTRTVNEWLYLDDKLACRAEVNIRLLLKACVLVIHVPTQRCNA